MAQDSFNAITSDSSPVEGRISMNSYRLTAPLVMAALALSACHDGREVESGSVISEKREVAEFNSITLRGSAQLQIQVGAPASLALEGDERAVKRVTTDVDGEKLYIRSSRKDWVFPGGGSRLVIKITVPSLNELRLEGGNDVKLSGFDGGSSRIDIEGAANIEAKGKLDELTVHMEGAGHANLRDLIASAATVTVDGVGSVYVHSTDSLDATMNGVGAILYSGTPRDVNTSMNGVGTISKDRESRGKDNEDAESKPEVEQQQKPPIDPDSLQPEYEKTDVKVEMTEVI
jgi:Putative auto-transporter adhesin, head GIN domain